MRILGGRWAGRTLISPGGRVRPTREEVRGAWLDALELNLRGARILDLFAGTGALGLEALSRGANHADFVEWNPAALHSLKGNVAALRVKDRTRIFKGDALAMWEAFRRERPYDIAFADPPYSSRLAERVVREWLEEPYSRILSVEHSSALRLPSPGSSQSFGETTVTTYTRIAELAMEA